MAEGRAFETLSQLVRMVVNDWLAVVYWRCVGEEKVEMWGYGVLALRGKVEI